MSFDSDAPFPFYSDLSGAPLQGGSVYFGASGQNAITNPLTVYWDQAGTQPAAQPISVSNGMTMRNGTAARVWVPGDYSRLVLDAKGRTVVYEPTPPSSLRATFAASGGAGLIGWLRNAVGAVFRWVADKLSDTYSVKDFGAKGDGVTDDTAAIQAAITAAPDYANIYFPPGTYYLTSASGIQLTGRNGLRLFGEGAYLKCAKNARAFYINGGAGMKVSGFQIFGTLSSDGYIGNTEQGRIVVQNATDVEVTSNRWNNTAGACFIQAGTVRFSFHHNEVLNTHAGIQTSSASYQDISITDNFFLGDVYNIPDQGSDDQIAIFGTASGRCIIARNFIDKQGPTAQNHARAISISVGGGSAADIVVADNIVQNVVTTTVANSRAAIDIEGTDGTHALARITVRGNLIHNCNTPIYLGPFLSNVIVEGNIVDGAVYLAGTNPQSGKGITSAPAGNGSGLAIRGNSVSNCDQNGIDVTVSYKIVIAGNWVTGCPTARGISVDTCQDVVLSGNNCIGNQVGAFVNNSIRVATNGNVLTGNSTYGLVVQGATYSGTICGNVLSNNTTAAFNNGTGTLDATITENYGLGSYGISSTATPSRNLCGTATFAAAATKVVNFARAEADASYRVALSAGVNEAIWVTAKGTGGFTLNSSNAASTAVVDWTLAR